MALGSTNAEGTQARFMAVAERWNGYRDLRHFYDAAAQWCIENSIVLGEGVIETVQDRDRARRHDYTLLTAPVLEGPAGLNSFIYDPSPIPEDLAIYLASRG